MLLDVSISFLSVSREKKPNPFSTIKPDFLLRDVLNELPNVFAHIQVPLESESMQDV